MPPKTPFRDVAILTGDLIGSTKVPHADLDRAFAILSDTAKEISGWSGGDTCLTRFRGDGWQMLIANPDLALRAAIIVLSRMRAPDSPLATRISIGIGPIDFAGTRDLSDAAGEALNAAGHGLDLMGKDVTLSIQGQVTSLHLGFVTLVSTIALNWTALQAEAVGEYLHPDQPRLEDIATKLGITPQATSYRVRGAAGNTLRLALAFWETDAAMRRLERERS